VNWVNKRLGIIIYKFLECRLGLFRKVPSLLAKMNSMAKYRMEVKTTLPVFELSMNFPAAFYF